MSHMISTDMPLDLFVKWQPLHNSSARFSSGLDNETGTIRMAGGGIWNPDDARRYFDQQRQLIDLARRRFGALKAFIDVRDWVVENPDSVTQFIAINSELFRPEDRLAAVVKSSLDKQHSRDALAVGAREAFISANAAETWLYAYSN